MTELCPDELQRAIYIDWRMVVDPTIPLHHIRIGGELVRIATDDGRHLEFFWRGDIIDADRERLVQEQE